MQQISSPRFGMFGWGRSNRVPTPESWKSEQYPGYIKDSWQPSGYRNATLQDTYVPQHTNATRSITASASQKEKYFQQIREKGIPVARKRKVTLNGDSSYNAMKQVIPDLPRDIFDEYWQEQNVNSGGKRVRHSLAAGDKNTQHIHVPMEDPEFLARLAQKPADFDQKQAAWLQANRHKLETE